MDAETETIKFQTVIGLYRSMAAAKWAAAEVAKQFAAELDAIATLGADLEAKDEAIPADSRQGAKSIFASDFSWNELVNLRNAAETFATAELETAIATYQAALGADVAH